MTKYSFRVPAGPDEVFGFGAADFLIGRPVQLRNRKVGTIIEAHVTEDGEFIEATVEEHS